MTKQKKNKNSDQNRSGQENRSNENKSNSRNSDKNMNQGSHMDQYMNDMDKRQEKQDNSDSKTWIPGFIRDMNFPMTKDEIIDRMKNNGVSRSVINEFQSIKDKTYNDFNELKVELEGLSGSFKNELKNMEGKIGSII